MGEKKDKEAYKPKPLQSFNLLPRVMNAGFGSIIGITLMFPFDLVKTRLQNQSIGPDGKMEYKNAVDCFMKTYKAEGYFGMYRGSFINIMLVTPEKALKIAINDMLRYYLSLPDGTVTFPRQLVAGTIVGMGQTIISCPMDLVKISGQDQGRIAKLEGRKLKPVGTKDIIKKIIAERGVQGLYTGVGPTLGREITFNIVYFPVFFGLYERGIAPGERTAPFWWSFGSGLIAAGLAAVSVNPFDVVKTRMQTLIKGKSDIVYGGMIDCFIQTYKKEGGYAFFKGFECRIMVLAPIYGIAQMVYYFGVAEAFLKFVGYPYLTPE